MSAGISMVQLYPRVWFYKATCAACGNYVIHSHRAGVEYWLITHESRDAHVLERIEAMA
jgi:hypothetical protein